MLKRLSTMLVSAGLLLGLTPAAASAAYGPYRHGDDDHYRCMYHCEERGYDTYHHRDDRYDRSDRYDRYDDRCRWRDRWGRYRYGRCRYDRIYHDGDCWYHDRYGWHRCRYGGGYRYYDDRYSFYGYVRPDESAHASGGYDSHRHHSGA